MSTFDELLEIKKNNCLRIETRDGRLALCPDMGGRVFAEVCGVSPHRIHLDTVRNPTQPFNNFGGGNFWPAPEGGKFGWNYDSDEWRVQPAINNQPFEVEWAERSCAMVTKDVALTNRAGTVVNARMSRVVETADLQDILSPFALKGHLTYETRDQFVCTDHVSVDKALIAAWTLEQFDATDDTVAFCAVADPKSAINFDFYEHPGSRITYSEKGFTYKVDGQKAGQIGIKVASKASFIGFYDLSRKLLCLRENLSPTEGLFFNIADNDQPEGPYSAADNYSIYNSDPEMAGFELETIGSADVSDGFLHGSHELVSRTTIAVFENPADIERFVGRHIG